MKKILLFLMLCVCMGAKAQRVDKPGEAYDYYCEVALEHLPGKFNRCRINLFAEINSNIPVLIDEAGERINFQDETKMLTYMSKRGWTYVDSYIGGGTKWKVYLLKKRVKADEEAKEHLKYETPKEAFAKKEW